MKSIIRDKRGISMYLLWCVPGVASLSWQALVTHFSSTIGQN